MIDKKPSANKSSSAGPGGDQGTNNPAAQSQPRTNKPTMQHMTINQFYNADALRWHTYQNPKIRNCGETIRSHQIECVELVHWFIERPTHSLIEATRWHDQPEVLLGDLSFPTKRDYPKIAKSWEEAEADVIFRYHVPQPANDYERKFLKFVDRLQPYMLVQNLAPEDMQLDDWHYAKKDLLTSAKSLMLDMELLNLKMKEPRL